MRVGLLTTSFPRDADDSAGSFVLGFARALSAAQHEVDVLAPEPREDVQPIRERGVAVSHVRYLWPRALERTFYGAGVPDNLRLDPLAWLGPVPFTVALALRSLAARAQWDAIVSHWALPCALVAGHVRGSRPHLAVLHSADVHLLSRMPARERWTRGIARGASALWFVAAAHRERFLSFLPPRERELVMARSWVGPMGVDLPPLPRSGERERARRELGLHRFSVLALGRLVHVKGLDVLLRASRERGWTVLIAGDGPDRSRLEAQSRTLGVDARFVGHVAGTQKASLLTAADAFVVPSRVLLDGRSEGVPVAMLEAMAHGLPIVASDVGGIAEIASHAGLLVPPERSDRLAAAIECLRDPDRARAAGAHAREIAARHRWSQTIEPALAVLSAQHRQSDLPPTP